MKEAACAAHGLVAAETQLWDYYQNSWYSDKPLDEAEGGLDAPISTPQIIEDQDLMLLEKVPPLLSGMGLLRCGALKGGGGKVEEEEKGGGVTDVYPPPPRRSPCRLSTSSYLLICLGVCCTPFIC